MPASTATLAIATDRAIDHRADYASEEDHKRIQHALQQGHGDHIAVGNMTDLMGEHGLDLIPAHLLQQTAADGNQRTVACSSGRESVHFRRIVNRDFGHTDAGTFRLSTYGRKQPGFGRIGRIFNHLGAGLPFGNPFRHGQRDERPTESDDGGKDQDSFEIDTGFRVGVGINAEHLDDNRQKQHDGEIGGDEKQGATHGLFTR